MWNRRQLKSASCSDEVLRWCQQRSIDVSHVEMEEWTKNGVDDRQWSLSLSIRWRFSISCESFPVAASPPPSTKNRSSSVDWTWTLRHSTTNLSFRSDQLIFHVIDLIDFFLDTVMASVVVRSQSNSSKIEWISFEIFSSTARKNRWGRRTCSSTAATLPMGEMINSNGRPLASVDLLQSRADHTRQHRNQCIDRFGTRRRNSIGEHGHFGREFRRCEVIQIWHHPVWDHCSCGRLPRFWKPVSTKWGWGRTATCAPTAWCRSPLGLKKIPPCLPSIAEISLIALENLGR